MYTQWSLLIICMTYYCDITYYQSSHLKWGWVLWNKIGRAGPHGVFVQTATVEAVQREVEALLSRADPQDLNPWLGQLACSLVSRSSTDPPFYPASGLAALVRTPRRTQVYLEPNIDLMVTNYLWEGSAGLLLSVIHIFIFPSFRTELVVTLWAPRVGSDVFFFSQMLHFILDWNH